MVLHVRTCGLSQQRDCLLYLLVVEQGGGTERQTCFGSDESEGMPLLGQTGVQGNVEEGSLNYRFYQLIEFTTEHEM